MERCPSPKKECLEAGTCHLSIHHLYYYARWYRSGIAKEFRNLEENKVPLPWCEHNALHNEQNPPVRPSINQMKEAIQRSREQRQQVNSLREAGL